MASPPFKVKAVYDYSSPHDDDLSFPNGQVITVVKQEDEDWYIGEYNDDSGIKHEGLFPKNFVEKYEPQAPPRPVRAQKKEEPVVAAAPPPAPPVAEPIDERSKPSEPEPESEPAQVSTPQSKRMSAAAGGSAISASTPSAPTSGTETASDSTAAKKAPPPVSEKPSSFKDRIAAFNRAGAAPVTPVKPAAASGFIKKPYVPPPPARDAYVPVPRQEPPTKFYRREEDPEIAERKTRDEDAAKQSGLMPGDTGDEEAEPAPKTTTLKERIAALQQQQAEQAARQMALLHKEQPQRPPQRRADSGDTIGSMAHPEDHDEPHEGVSRASTDTSRDVPMPLINRRTSTASRREPTLHDTLNDGYEAQHHGAQEDAEATETVDAVERSRPAPTSPLSRTTTDASAREISRPAPVQEDDEDQQEEDAEEEEEDEEAAEARRKLELRQRMAKMSGGMGMGGMFGMQMGAPPLAAKKKAAPAASSEHQFEAVASSAAPTQRMPMIPMPGLPTMRSPPQSPTSERPPVVRKESEPGLPMSSSRAPEAVPDIEDLEQQPSAAAPQHRRAPSYSQDRPSPPARQLTAGAPPVPGSQGRAVPPPPPRGPMSPSAASGAGDEMSLRDVAPPQSPVRRDTGMSIRAPPPPIPGTAPASSTEPRSPIAPPRRTSFAPDSPASDKRRSNAVMPGMPPIPMPSTEQRGAPPPPPTGPPAQHAPVSVPNTAYDDDEGDDNDEYEGDYDTDRRTAHQDVSRSDDRAYCEDDGNSSEDAYGTNTAPSLPPSTSRAVPPPPPSFEPPPRRSVEAPQRAMPPLPPSLPVRGPAPPPTAADDYDPYRYNAPAPGLPQRTMPGPAPGRPGAQPPALPNMPPPPPGRAMPPPVPQSPIQAAPPRMSMGPIGPAPPPAPAQYSAPLPPPVQYTAPPPPVQHFDAANDYHNVPAPAAPRRSVEQAAPVRRSVERPRASTDNGIIARDVDLAQGSQWWTKPNMPPPAFQGRPDVLFEVEETTTPHRGGRTTVSKDVYVLFPDYSQTVITARFDSKAPGDVTLEQRHEPPPPRPRQDQLEAASRQYGQAIFSAAHSKANSPVADGSAQAFISGAVRSQPTALLPVGSRAYGALIYVNIANATVQQLDEIRPGDIISFRNAKFQGKHGLTKYSEDVGKPDHAAVVVEWDGTKKKVRAYEQGRESKKVKMESFRVGDLRSGEVKVWRVMGRNWVGWEGES